jgi:hypothetical protein
MDLPRTIARCRRCCHSAGALLLSLLAPLLLVPLAIAQAPALPTQHIEITALGSWADHSQHLSTKNFIVTQQGHRYPIRLAQPPLKDHAPASDVPTHLLVVVRGHTAKPVNTGDLLKQLAPVFERGWQVSIMRPDGYATPYLATAADLLTSLAAPKQSSPPPGMTLAELQTIPGRCVLLVVGPLTRKDNGWFQTERDFVSSIYVADGGVPTKRYPEYADADGGTYTPDLPPAIVRVRSYSQGMAHEKDVAAAVKDALLDAHNFFDLSFTPVTSLVTDLGPVTLTLHRMQEQTVSVDTYVSAPADPNAPSFALRSHENLIVDNR